MSDAINTAIKHLSLIANRWKDTAFTLDEDDPLGKLLDTDAENLILTCQLLTLAVEGGNGETVKIEPSFNCSWENMRTH